MKESKFSTIKKGEFFRFPGMKKVYIFNGGGPKRGFNYFPFDDVNDHKQTKTNRKIETDFDF